MSTYLPDTSVLIDALNRKRERAAVLAKYARQGVSPSLPDTLIAAISIEHRSILITGNRKHFPVPDPLIHPLE